MTTIGKIDADPFKTGAVLGDALKELWTSGDVEGLLAAPFFCVVPFEWNRHFP